MNTKRLIKQLEIDEAIRLRVYIDSLGYKTVGIGHLIKDSDPEDLRALEAGDKISEKLCYQLFISDLIDAVQGATTVFYDAWDSFPDEAQEVFINMVFNLGVTRFLKFKKTIAAAYAHNWPLVSKEMLDSKWASQVGNRAGRLSAKIRGLT